MAYGDFKSLQQIRDLVDLTIVSNQPLFREVQTISVSQQLQNSLTDNVPLALNINTEKARSEFIVAPILLEVWKMMKRQVGLFSGVAFDVDPEKGLNGFCDFILSVSADQTELRAPVVCVVEAKNENIKSGYPQCMAEMIAASIFNQQQANPVEQIFGVVTTGSNWKFLILQDTLMQIDFDEYLIGDVGKILGILMGFLTNRG